MLPRNLALTVRLGCQITLIFSCLSAGLLAAEQKHPTYADWKARCLKTPANRTLNGRFPTQEQLPLPDSQLVQDLAIKTLNFYRASSLAELPHWVGNQPKETEFFDITRSYYTRAGIPFQPFAQKLQFQAGAEIIFHGDFHGDIRSFISTLEWLNQTNRMEGFQIKNPHTYLIFLGDYTDRGAYGVEVLYSLLRLKLANPDRVYMARGNHEDFRLTAAYGFLQEIQTKYGEEFSPLPLWRIFDFLPVVIYAGTQTDFLQCNHGGMEAGYEPKTLLNSEGAERFQFLGELRQQTFAQKHPNWFAASDPTSQQTANDMLRDFLPQSPTSPATIGFMWNDFSIFASEPGLAFNPNRPAFVYGASGTKYLLDTASEGNANLRAVFRAHQHSSRPSPMMNRLLASQGAFRHWQGTDRPDAVAADLANLQALLETTPKRSVPSGSVWTFNVAPDSVYGTGNDFSFDTIGVLTTSEAFQDWRLQVVNIPVNLN